MNQLEQVFNYEGNEVRTITKDGEPWWVLKDVCAVLGLSTPTRVSERLDEDEVSQTHFIDTIGRQQETLIINEGGLYNVIIRSDKPEAKKSNAGLLMKLSRQSVSMVCMQLNQLLIK